MTILEIKSLRRKKSMLNLVKKGEFSPAYALMLVEELSDSGKLTETDYEDLGSYLEELLNEPEPVEEETEQINEQYDTEMNSTEENIVESEEE